MGNKTIDVCSPEKSYPDNQTKGDSSPEVLLDCSKCENCNTGNDKCRPTASTPEAAETLVSMQNGESSDDTVDPVDGLAAMLASLKSSPELEVKMVDGDEDVAPNDHNYCTKPPEFKHPSVLTENKIKVVTVPGPVPFDAKDTMVLECDPLNNGVTMLDLRVASEEADNKPAEEELNEESFVSKLMVSPKYRLDFADPEIFAKDVVKVRFTSGLPVLQDICEATEFVFHTGVFFERFLAMVRYDSLLAIKKAKAASDLSEEEIMMLVRKYKYCPDDEIEARGFSGELAVKALMTLMSFIDSSPKGETLDEYSLRHEKVVTEFVTALNHWAQLQIAKHDLSQSSPIRDLQLLKEHLNDLPDYCYTNTVAGMGLVRKGQFRLAAYRLTDAAFAAMTRKNLSPNSTNILGKYNSLFRASDEYEEDDEDYIELVPESDSDSVCSRADSEYLEVPCEHEAIWFEIMLQMVNCLINDGRLKRASVTASSLMSWMTSYKLNGQAGHFATSYYSRYSKLLFDFAQCEQRMFNYRTLVRGTNVAIENYLNLVPHATADRNLFLRRESYYLSQFHAIHKNSELKEGERSDIIDDIVTLEHERRQAKIIVDPSHTKAMVSENNQLVVPDVLTAMKVAKDNDIIFLKEGMHYLNLDRKLDKDNEQKGYYRITKAVQVIGEHPLRCILIGTFTLTVNVQVLFKRISLMFGSQKPDPEKECGAFITEGTLTLVECFVRQSYPTAIAMLGKSDSSKTQSCSVSMIGCNVDGGGHENFIKLTGEGGNVTVDTCYVTSIYRFIATAGLPPRGGYVALVDTVVINSQNPVQLIVHHSSTMETVIRGCHFRNASLDHERPSIGVAITGGTAVIKNNLFQLTLLPVYETGISLHSLQHASVSMNRVETPDDENRSWILSTGIMLSENVKTSLLFTSLDGLRIGIKITNEIRDIMNRMEIIQCNMRNCSIGISVDEQHNGGETNLDNQSFEGQDSRSPQTPKNIREEPRRSVIDSDGDSDVNLRVSCSGCTFEQCYYGVMNQSRRARLFLESNNFMDIPKAIILTYKNLGLTTELYKNVYRFSRTYSRAAREACNSRSRKAITRFRDYMHAEFACAENLPSRISYDKSGFHVITFDEHEKKYKTNYQKT